MDKLTIPEKISLEKEIGWGIRRKDLPKLITLALPGTIIGIAVWSACLNRPLMRLISLFLTVVYLFLSCILVARIDGNRSVLDQIQLFLRFLRGQHTFYYKKAKEDLYYVDKNRSEEANSSGIY